MAAPEEMLKSSPFEFVYDRPSWDSSQILGCPDPLIEQVVKYIIQLGKTTENLNLI